MPRSAPIPRVPTVCQICDSIVGRRLYSTKPTLRAHNATTRPRIQIERRLLKTNTIQKRALVSGVFSTEKTTSSSTDTRDTPIQDGNTPKKAREELSSVTNMMTYIERSKSKVLTNRGIPSEADINAALRACWVVADYIMDDTVQPQLTHMVNELDSTASEILSLDRASNSHSSKSSETPSISMTAQVKQIIDKISHNAYAVISHPPVFITPKLLEKYVKVQARLGKPETLPQIFQMYAWKPMPRESKGSISYVKQSPNKIANAIEPEVIEKALDTAIEVKNLDAAVGIVENSYATKAFIRNKLLRKCLVPGGTLAATPVAAYLLATSFSNFQNTMDTTSATNIAFAGILAYVGFTGSLGMVALTTANDQMNRVTWNQGVPLRSRWIREEERAALDKIACAWGFEEKWRQGEEEGTDWDALREYINTKGMVLDRTELMEGME
ncbi:uncharacterized protein GGS22DRAFT_69509 [Annulohypoxylon maeteangense]|uniref:uncharacterized protein n=1 Tax=Annulohypoxylon maeteangense TaxID=1927788 RepID=UPI0020074C70|nr:uncharacterized protein GGS22DRAFT_69509 [Annulohypoxylon maeteangense]KAI0889281.1 hypothetical protein GGS22DRAFT_69509 [Annulohypoxylon maeteangense]